MNEPRGPQETTPGADDDAVVAGAPQHADAAPADEAGEAAAVARVRAADPARDAAPDAARLHARLAETTGVTVGDPVDGRGAATPVDELAAARARRRGPARWLQVAAVAAGVALVGGGGYAVGAAGGSDPAAPPIALQGPEGAGAAAMAADTADAKMIGPGWFGGRTVFRGSGLDGAAGTSRAWAFDATSAATAETAARVAQVLGVAGEPRQEWGQWVVGANDGLSASVQVGVDGQASMWFYDRAWDPSVCSLGLPETLDGAEPAEGAGALEGGGTPEGAGSAGVTAEQADPQLVDPGAAVEPELREPDPADPSVCDPASTPTGDAAIAKARDLMARLGVDTGTYELTVSQDTGVPGLVGVTGAQVVDGTQTGLGWSVQLAGTGVQSVSGPLATLVELGTYEHVSADDAVERLNDPRFGASYGGVVPLAARAAGAADDAVSIMPAEPTDAPTVPPVPAPGEPVAWPVQDVTITGARLGVTPLTTPTGATLLVPAWELTDADGGTWSVVAVVEDQLDLSAR
ncbi:conserved hypothetical protein [Cellulomonas flavigena DSM 20109]|uniref:Uncharacterized protein n=1 Tax=Cellulomonas flavigena (strain ATCC 482 / DSM 20109 / BCRC 11376 / JCM 18109 / NBRC 3775 / NCIMB 8073 / NRS 134) TaxID=446466 RepID=D5UIK2_CELFN|nr:hypothetical protein [Cellulomonas flavigena]ADG73501.1 conserved hypothetical protein [Cellulomonas flavigena DSM 20109]